jgi:hypothetical protein
MNILLLTSIYGIRNKVKFENSRDRFPNVHLAGNAPSRDTSRCAQLPRPADSSLLGNHPSLEQ